MTLQRPAPAALTGEHGGHERGEHEEEHAEEEAAGVVVGLRRLVADAQVQQANQNAHRQVRDQAQPRQRLQAQACNMTSPTGARSGAAESASKSRIHLTP